MNPFLHTAVLATLAMAVVAAFSAGIWWLVIRRRAPKPAFVPPPPHSAHAFPPSSVLGDGDEWESFAPYPDHALHAAHPFTSAFNPEPTRERRAGLHDVAAYDAPPPEADLPPRPVRDTPSDAGDTFSPFAAWQASDAGSSPAAVRCPHCNSTRVDTLDVGRRTGSTIGGVAGATGAVAMTLSGAETGAAVGAIGGPVGSIVGGLAGALIAGLLGSSMGSAAGSALGAAIDENILDNYRCRSCGHVFGSALH